MSSFVGLNTALSGIMAQRRAMEVAAQNIANQNTEGYTRQRTDLSSVGGNTVPAIHSTWQGAGAGVTVTGQTRIRDAFLEGRAQVESGIHANLESADAVMASIEQAFGEPGSTGLQNQMAELWGSFDDVAKNPGDEGVRRVALQQAQGVVDVFHDIDRALTSLAAANTEKVDVLVTEVNATSAAVGQLNGAIKQGSMAGLPVNELMDKRDVLVGKLATMVGATARPAADGVVDVLVGGDPLVTGRVAKAVVAGGGTGLEYASGPPFAVALVAGTARGLIDSINPLLAGPPGVIASYRDQLDVVAKALADQVNAVQTGGYDLIPSVTPGALFSGSTAATLEVAIIDPRGIAAALEAPDASGPSLDDGNARKLAGIGTTAGSPDAGYRTLVGNLGVAAQASGRRLDVQADALGLINASREAQSGVSTDEEMTQLLSYQRAYEAAARVMTTVDAALDTLINRTGLVGR